MLRYASSGIYTDSKCARVSRDFPQILYETSPCVVTTIITIIIIIMPRCRVIPAVPFLVLGQPNRSGKAWQTKSCTFLTVLRGETELLAHCFSSTIDHFCCYILSILGKIKSIEIAARCDGNSPIWSLRTPLLLKKTQTLKNHDHFFLIWTRKKLIPLSRYCVYWWIVSPWQLEHFCCYISH